jgi:hypothetical protein
MADNNGSSLELAWAFYQQLSPQDKATFELWRTAENARGWFERLSQAERNRHVRTRAQLLSQITAPMIDPIIEDHDEQHGCGPRAVADLDRRLDEANAKDQRRKPPGPRMTDRDDKIEEFDLRGEDALAALQWIRQHKPEWATTDHGKPLTIKRINSIMSERRKLRSDRGDPAD